jgi:hypothetical protein
VLVIGLYIILFLYIMIVGPCKSDRIFFGPISVRFFFSSGEYLIAKSSTRLDLYNRRSDLQRPK